MHVHPVSRDHIARRRQPIGRQPSSRRMDHTAAGGATVRVVHHRDRRNASALRNVTTARAPNRANRPRRSPIQFLEKRRWRRIGGGRRSTPPRRNATCARRCNARASYRREATQPRKSAWCCPDPTRRFGARRQPRATRHAARARRNRAAETNPMNDSSGDFEKKGIGAAHECRISVSDAREHPQAHQTTAEGVNDQVHRHALRRTI